MYNSEDFKVGDVLVGVNESGTILELLHVVGYKDRDILKYNDYSRKVFGAVLWTKSYWFKHILKFKAQDYFCDLSNPTETEISLVQLQFPEIDVEEFKIKLKQLIDYIKQTDNLI